MDKEEKKKTSKTKSNKELDKLKEEYQILNDKYLRTIAEISNIRKRNEEDISKMVKYEGEDFIKKLLVVIDNFERAIAMDDDNQNDEVTKFLSGFKMIYANLILMLKEIGVIEIEALGKEFDPSKMEAVLTESIVEEEANIVLEVLQKGYIYKDKVIRAAMVKVNE